MRIINTIRKKSKIGNGPIGYDFRDSAGNFKERYNYSHKSYNFNIEISRTPLYDLKYEIDRLNFTQTLVPGNPLSVLGNILFLVNDVHDNGWINSVENLGRNGYLQ